MSTVNLDLHVHSRFSHDSSSRISDLIRAAKNAGLDGFALTDHDTGEGWQILQEKNERDFILIQGMEITTTEGHILGYFLKNPEPPEENDPHHVVDWIHEQGGMAVLAHPFLHRRAIPRSLTRELDGIELKNFRYSRETVSVGKTSRRRSILGISHEFQLTQTAGSDAHVPSDVGKARTGLDLEEENDLKQNLIQSNCWTKGEKIGWFRHVARKMKHFFSRPLKRGKKKKKKKKKRKKNY